MNRVLSIVFIALCIIWTSGCKGPQKIAQSQKETNDSIPELPFIPQPSPVYITQEGDTLQSLDEEYEVSLSKTITDSISFVAVGDIMMGTNYPNDSYLPRDSGQHLWRAVDSYLLDADVTFGNLEGVILNEGGEHKTCKNPKACYIFRTPDYLSYHFKQHGFDILSLANNHANDFGVTGRRNTQKVLDSLGIKYAGSIETPFTSFTIKKTKIGIVAVAPNKGTLSIHDSERIREIVLALDSLNDIVVVSFHAGAEGAKSKHVTRKREFYYGEDRGNVYEFAHRMIDYGADVLIGHGPHVPRAIEVYKNRLIFYSLGNFLTYGRFNLKGLNGEAPLAKFYINSSGEFLSGQIISFYQGYDSGPRYDPQGRAATTIKKLSEEDFPESPIRVDDSGRIIYLQNRIQK